MPSDVTRTAQNPLDQLTTALLAQVTQAAGHTAASGDAMPPTSSGPRLSSGDPALPKLPAPAGPLALSTLLRAVGDEVRKNSVRSGVDAIKAKGDEQERIGKDQLSRMQEQLDKIEKQKHLSWWEKAFSVVASVFGAVASIASIAVGVITVNPVLVVGGAMALGLTINALVETATDGEYGLSAMVSKAAKFFGADEKTAQWIALGVQVALVVATVAVTLGAGLCSSATQVSGTAMRVASMATKVVNVANGVTGATQGGLGIASSVVGYQAAENAVGQKKLEAILEGLREAIKAEHALVEAETKRASALMEKVMDIVRNCNHTQQAISSANPSMA